jgi:molybdenum cofactor cytidylyltransferase
VIPAAIVAAGGRIDHFGMPVDPGNLLLLGHVGEQVVLGLPGCARSPKVNGFDWVLERLVAGLPVGPGEIMRMGSGGLLAEIPSRPLPRAGATSTEEPKPEAKPRGPRIGALVLAAGQSRRMGGPNKLLADIPGSSPGTGAPMVARVAQRVLASRARPIIAVLGTGRTRSTRRSASCRSSACAIHSAAASLAKRGIAALPPDLRAADLPWRHAADHWHIDRLIAAINLPRARDHRPDPARQARQSCPLVEAVLCRDGRTCRRSGRRPIGSNAIRCRRDGRRRRPHRHRHARGRSKEATPP